MLSNRILNAGILEEICRDRLIASVRVLFLRLLRVHALTTPSRTASGVPGQAALHPENIVGILRKLTLSISGFQDKLCQRYRCQDAALLHIRREKRTYLLDRIRLGQILQAAACVPFEPEPESDPCSVTVTFSARSPILAYIQFPGQLLLANHL